VQDEGSASAQEERRPSKQTLDLEEHGEGEGTDRRSGVERLGNFRGTGNGNPGGGNLWARGPRPWACRAGTV
jgi:hypothetical protein